MGNFAQQSLPLADSATLTIKRVGSQSLENVTVITPMLSVRSGCSLSRPLAPISRSHWSRSRGLE